MTISTALGEYQDLAMRTCGQTDYLDMIVNAGLSIAEEVGELIEHIDNLYHHLTPEGRDNTKKEAGDICWYIAEMCKALDIPMSTFLYPDVQPVKRITDLIADFAIHAGRINGAIKKHVFHSHTINLPDMYKHLNSLLGCVVQLCKLIGFTLEEVLAANLDKLRKRYPEGFSAEASKNRTE